MAQTVKNPPLMQEIQVRSLGQEDSLEEGTATHFNILGWRIHKELDTTEQQIREIVDKGKKDNFIF